MASQTQNMFKDWGCSHVVLNMSRNSEMWYLIVGLEIPRWKMIFHVGKWNSTVGTVQQNSVDLGKSLLIVNGSANKDSMPLSFVNWQRARRTCRSLTQSSKPKKMWFALISKAKGSGKCRKYANTRGIQRVWNVLLSVWLQTDAFGKFGHVRRCLDTCESVRIPIKIWTYSMAP